MPSASRRRSSFSRRTARGIESKPGAAESDLLTVYIGYRGAQTIGYALSTRTIVRTLSETFLIVPVAAGGVTATHLLAFYEPANTRRLRRWLGQFRTPRLRSELASAARSPNHRLDPDRRAVTAACAGRCRSTRLLLKGP